MPKIIYVHGFLGETGSGFGDALAAIAAERGKDFEQFRWEAGKVEDILLPALMSQIKAITATGGKPDLSCILKDITEDVLLLSYTAWKKSNANAQIAGEALARQLTEPVILVGFSLGGLVSSACLNNNPNMVKKLVLCGAAIPNDLNFSPPTVNFFSEEDVVLKYFYPAYCHLLPILLEKKSIFSFLASISAFSTLPAGLAGLPKKKNVKNFHIFVPDHLGYDQFADKIFRHCK